MIPPLLAAQNALRQRNIPEAERLCRQILFTSPQNPDAMAILANCLMATGRDAEAERLLTAALASSPDHFGALMSLGSLLARQGNTAKAAEFILKAGEVSPNDGAARYQVGFALIGLGRNEQAVAFLEQAALRSPQVAEIRHFWAVALQRLGRTADAASQFRAAIVINPKASLSYIELGNLMLSVGDPESALPNFEKLVEIEPTSPKGHFFLARTLAELNRFEEAEAALHRAIKLDGKFAPAQILFGRLKQQRGQFVEAEQIILDAIAINPENPDGYYAILNGKRVVEADRPLMNRIEELLAAGQLNPADRRPLEYALGKAFDDLGDYSIAMKHFDEANRLAQARLVSLGRVFDAERLHRRVDEIVVNFGDAFLSAARGLGSSSAKPIFIVGMARSGTTLLEQMVSSHSEVAGAGEMGAWMEVETMKGGPPDAKRLEEIAAAFLAKLDQVSPSAAHVTVKSPQNYMLLGQILAIFPNCRILHCRRNPIDTCLSIYTTNFFAGPDFAHDKRNLVLAYREYLRVMSHWRKVLPADRFMDVDYEELVADREPRLRQIARFLGLTWEDTLLHHEKNDHPIATPSVWQARQPVFARSVERWRRYEPWLGPLRELADD